MFYNKVEICGVNTAILTQLTDEEKKDLLQKTKSENPLVRDEARKKLICGNLRLVLSIIQRISAGGSARTRRENPDDLFQVGCIGLIKAVDHFNVDMDVKFSTYAVPMIIGEIRRYLRDNNTIRISRSVRDLAYRALGARENWMREHKTEPDATLLAGLLGEKKEDVVNAMEAIVEPISLYDPVYSENGDTMYVLDQISDSSHDASDDAWLENILLRDALRTLGERERRIIQLRFYRNKTQTEIADMIGISQAQVSRLEKGALEHLRARL